MGILQNSKTKIIAQCILALLVAIAYAPTFSGEFILDDRPLVKDNLAIRQFGSPASYVFHEDGVSKEDHPDSHTGYYRPLVDLTYALDFKIWGMKPSGFRITNLVLHFLTCLILYQSLARLSRNPFIPFFAALLFALHPVNTESVAWVASRNNILVSLFSLLSFHYYLRNKNETRIRVGLLSYIFFALALCSKEFGVMLLPILFLYNRFVKDDKTTVKNEILGYIPFVFILFIYFILRAHTIGSVLTPLSTQSLWKSIYYVPFLIIFNLRLVLFPTGLHSFVISYPSDYLCWQALSGFAGASLLGFLLWKQRKNKIMVFSFLAFFIALFPILNIINTSAVTLVSMRWLYFPMMFLSFSLVRPLEKSLSVSRPIALCALVSVAVYLGAYSNVLNRNVWHDEDTFFEQEVLHFDNLFYAGGLAESLFDKRELIEAERYFQIAIDKCPHEARNYINYSALLIDTGRVDEALFFLDRAKPLKKTSFREGQWFNNRGMVLFQLGRKDEALTDFEKAVSVWPRESQFWSNLGGAYGSLEDYRNSISSFEKGLEIAPSSTGLVKNLAITYMKIGNYEEAITILERVPDYERKGSKDIMALLAKARQELSTKGN